MADELQFGSHYIVLCVPKVEDGELESGELKESYTIIYD